VDDGEFAWWMLYIPKTQCETGNVFSSLNFSVEEDGGADRIHNAEGNSVVARPKIG
jgi:hypothetical protein